MIMMASRSAAAASGIVRRRNSSSSSSASLQWVRKVQSRLAEHIQNQTTDLMSPAMQSSRAGDLYFQKNRDDVAAQAAPALILPSCLLPPGHMVTDYLPSNANFSQQQTPILVYREPISSGGRVRAYVNQCRHRGAQLVPTTTTTTSMTLPQRWKGSAVTCPYHAWTYDIRDGSLKKIPGEEAGFPCLDKASLGLKSLPCKEMAGGIWVGSAGGAGEEQVMDWSFGEIDRELKDFWLEPLSPDKKSEFTITSARLVGFREWKLNANWQLLVETFLESYHVQYLHHNTLGLVTHGNRMVVDRLGGDDRPRSLRHTVPLVNFDYDPSSASSSSAAAVVSPTDPFFQQTTTTYFLFPCVSISLFKRFAVFMSVVPERSTKDVDDDDDDDENGNASNSSSSSWSRIRMWAVTHATAQGEPDLLAKQQRDLESVIQGIEEDWECAESIQRGLTHDTIVHHGRFEGNNIDFLRNVGEVSELLLAKRQQETTTMSEYSRLVENRMKTSTTSSSR